MVTSSELAFALKIDRVPGTQRYKKLTDMQLERLAGLADRMAFDSKSTIQSHLCVCVVVPVKRSRIYLWIYSHDF